MNKLLLAIAALPLMAGTANAASQRLSDKQMDGLTAGFSATSIADARGLVGPLETVLTTTTTLALVVPYATATVSQGEITWTLLGSLSAAPSVTSTTPLFSIPGLAGQ